MYKLELIKNENADLKYFSAWLEVNYSEVFKGFTSGLKIIIYFDSELDELDKTEIESYYSGLTVDDVEPFTDFNDIKTWHKYGVNSFDFIYVGTEIQSIVTVLGGGDVDAGFQTLNDEEKDICSQYSIGSKSVRLAFLGEEKMLQYSETIHQKSKEAREMRMKVIYSKFYLELENADKDEIITDIINNNCFTTYIEFARYGSVLSQSDGAYDWLKGLNSFAGNGFIDKGYTPLTMTLTELSDYCCDVLFNGNYTIN